MDKLIYSNAREFGLPLTKTSGLQTGVPIEKMSADRSGQLDWLQAIGGLEPRVVDWLGKNPLDFGRYVYVAVIPLGSDESWAQTSNGDSFERKWLKPENPEWGHKSFEQYAHAFLNHRNKDPKLGFGDVPMTCFSDPMDRVEGVWRLDKHRAREVGAQHATSRIERDGAASISMGCRVPYDVCSLCGNKAKSPKEYCRHPKDPGFGHIDPITCQLCRVFNPFPKFFDLSDVIVPAARESGTLAVADPAFAAAYAQMQKASGHVLVIPSALLAAQRWGTTKSGLYVPSLEKASAAVEPVKMSDIVKRAPVLAAGMIRPLHDSEPELDDDTMKESGLGMLTLPQVLSTLAGVGVVLSPEEIARVVRTCGGQASSVPSKPEIAQAWGRVTDNHPHLSVQNYNPFVAKRLGSFVEERSVCFPHLFRRIAIGTGVSSDGAKRDDGRITIDVTGTGTLAPLAQYVAAYLKTMAVRLGEFLRDLSAYYADHEQGTLGGGLLTEVGSLHDAARMGDMPATAALPSSYILERAGKGSDGEELERSVRALHVPGSEHLLGGLMAS